MALLAIGRCIGHQTRWTQREPNITEILSDPVIIAVMKADGVDPVALEAQLSSIAQNSAAVRQRTRYPGTLP